MGTREDKECENENGPRTAEIDPEPSIDRGLRRCWGSAADRHDEASSAEYLDVLVSKVGRQKELGRHGAQGGRRLHRRRLLAGLPSPGTCLQPEGGSRLLAVQERNLPRLVEQQGGAGAQGEAGGHVVGVAFASNRRAGWT